MECLGLHNKPTAEVHPGHKLTGPKEEDEVIIFINCNWVITRWQWLFYMYTNMKKKKKK
jgi:hypothetical protein